MNPFVKLAWKFMDILSSLADKLLDWVDKNDKNSELSTSMKIKNLL